MRIMLDTNILISAVFFPSTQTRKLIRALSNNHRIILCDYVLEELRLVVERKFSAKKEALEKFFAELPFDLSHTPESMDIGDFPSVRDKKDSPILATAILEGVDLFITGDRDFLVLDIKNPKILTMTEFLDKYL